MSGLDGLTGWERLTVYRPVAIYLGNAMRFGSFNVAEPDSNHPAHRASLLRLPRSKGRSKEDAEDLIQEAMLRLHLYAKSNVVVNEEAFLRHAVRNLAIDDYRRNRPILGREVQIDDVERQHPLIAPSPSPEEILDSEQRLNELTAMLDAVSKRTREIYLACRSGYIYEEVAGNMNIAKMTVRRHIARANVIIRKHVER